MQIHPFVVTPSRSRKLAFTIVEVLVIVAIIAVLASLLIPSLREARNAAKQVVCATQIRGWCQISNTYAADNKDSYAPRFAGNSYTHMFSPGWDVSRTASNKQIQNTFWWKMGPYMDGGFVVQETVSTPAEDANIHKSMFCTESNIAPAWRKEFVISNGGSLEYGYYPYWDTGSLSPSATRPWSPQKASEAFDQFGGRRVLWADVNMFRESASSLQTAEIRYTVHAGNTGPVQNVAFTDIGTALGSDRFIHPAVALPRGTNVGYVDGSVNWIRSDRLYTSSRIASRANTHTSYYWARD